MWIGQQKFCDWKAQVQGWGGVKLSCINQSYINQIASLSGLSLFAKTLTSWWTWSSLKTTKMSTTPSSLATRASPTQTPSSKQKLFELPHPLHHHHADHPIRFNNSVSQAAGQRPVQPAALLPHRVVALSATWGTDSHSSSRQTLLKWLFII